MSASIPPASIVPTALALTGLAAVAVGAFVLLVAPRPPPPRRAQLLAPQTGSLLGPAAYRLPLVPAEDVDVSIAWYFGKIQTDPGGMNHALLADAYLRKVRAGGSPHYYLLAEQAARRSLEVLPHDNDRARIVLARVAEARHDFVGALRIADGVLAEHPLSTAAMAVQHACHLACGRLGPALEIATRLVEHERSAGTFAMRAAALLALGRDAEASADLTHALSIEEVGELESSARVRTLMGRAAARAGSLALADQLYREALRILPGHVPALMARAELARRTGHTREAEADFAAAEAVGWTPALGIARARLMARRAPDAAAELMQRAERDVRRELASGGYGHRRDLASILLERDSLAARAEALELMEQEAALRRDAITLELLARAHLAVGHVAAARAAINEALALGAREPDLVDTAARIEQVAARAQQPATDGQEVAPRQPTAAGGAR